MRVFSSSHLIGGTHFTSDKPGLSRASTRSGDLRTATRAIPSGVQLVTGRTTNRWPGERTNESTLMNKPSPESLSHSNCCKMFQIFRMTAANPQEMSLLPSVWSSSSSSKLSSRVAKFGPPRAEDEVCEVLVVPGAPVFRLDFPFTPFTPFTIP